MQKFVHYIFLAFFVTCIAACGGGSSTTTPKVDNTLTTKFASYSSLPGTLRAGAVQWGAISTSTKFSNYSVSIVAGNGGIPALIIDGSGAAASFNRPTGITTPDGIDFYVADFTNNVIRKIDKDGAVTLFAGSASGSWGHADATGTAATFYHPSDITTDGTNLYVADSYNNSVRIINIKEKSVTTIGSIDGSFGSIDSLIQTEVRFSHPTGITTDGKNVFVADSGNHTVRRIDIDTKAVFTLAGASGVIGSADNILGSAARFYQPTRITTDGKTLYLTDFMNHTIRTIDIKSSEVKTLAGVPGALSADAGSTDSKDGVARFNQPNGITTDGLNLYVTDSYLNTIRKIVITSGFVSTLLGQNGTPLDLHTPMGITTDGNSLFVADTSLLHTDNTYTYSNSILRIH